jgi:hypothetical protein
MPELLGRAHVGGHENELDSSKLDPGATPLRR